MNHVPPVKIKPLLRGHFHQAMFFMGIGALIPLLPRCQNSLQLLSILIYAICALTMFGISSLYHRVTWTPEKRQLWKKFDHAGIFLMIAGSSTPVATLALGGDNGHRVLVTIWMVALVGIVQSLIFVNWPKWVSSSIYLIAGYLILPYISELRVALGDLNLGFLIAGGVSYSIGAICYALKKPILNPKYFSYHEVFHLFVNLGAIFHFIVISWLVG